MKLHVLILAITTFVLGCSAPIFRSESERFAGDPAVLNVVRPYLADWATLPPDETLEQRQEIGSQLDVGIGVIYRGSDNDRFAFVKIDLDHWENWTRGYLYVQGDPGDIALLEQRSGFTLRRVEDHIYVFNEVN